jgi:hypothetical protein
MIYKVEGNNLLICCKTFDEFKSAFLNIAKETNSDDFFGILQTHCDIFRECCEVGYVGTETPTGFTEIFYTDQYFEDIETLAKYYWVGKNTTLVIVDESLMSYNPKKLFKFEY